MKVYVVTGGWAYEGERVVAVFSSRDLAVAYIAEQEEALRAEDEGRQVDVSTARFDDRYVYELDVDAPPAHYSALEDIS